MKKLILCVLFVLFILTIAQGQQEIVDPLEQRVQALEERADNQLVKIRILKAALYAYRYELEPRHRAVIKELDKFYATDAENYKDRIWLLQEAIRLDDDKSHQALHDLIETLELMDKPNAKEYLKKE